MSVIIASRRFSRLSLLIGGNAAELSSQRELLTAFIYLIGLGSLVCYSIVLGGHHKLLLGLQVMLMPGSTFIFFGLLGDQSTPTRQILLRCQYSARWHIVIPTRLVLRCLKHLLLLLVVISSSYALLRDKITTWKHAGLFGNQLAAD